MLESVVVSVLTIVVIFGAPVLAHMVGAWVSRTLRVRPGAIREWMPSIPDHIEKSGRAEARWERRRRAVEAKLLKLFGGGVEGAEAHQLAGQLGEDPEVVAGALGHIREEIPTRLRVTKSGKLLHDFSAEAIARLKSKRRMALPARFFLFCLGVLANIGAAWPVFMGLLVAAGALVVIASGGSAVIVGGTALGVVAGLFIANLLGGWLTHLVLTPGLGFTNRPRVGKKEHAEASVEKLQKEQAAGWSFFDVGDSSYLGDVGHGCTPDIDLDLDEGLPALIIIILLVAVVAACTFAIVVFLRGVWRAVAGSSMPPLDTSPTHWVRSAQPSDSLERFIPTNDLVLRVLRVLRRLVSHTHPRDSTIVGRTMARVRNQGGRISAFELALQEGLDLDEATAIGARLSGRAGGSIDVTEHGELDFVFPHKSLSDVPAEWDDDLHAEYIDYSHGDGTVRRRPGQFTNTLPVNLPGIAWSHVKSASRLAAGTVLMMLTGIAVVSFIPDVPLFVKIAVDSFLPLMAVGTFVLAGVLRYVSSTLAMHGVRRDIRRAAFLTVWRALNRGDSVVEFDTLAGRLLNTLRPAWKQLDRALVVKEIDGVIIDLDLEPDSGAIAESEGTMWYSVAPLQERLDALAAHRTAAAEVQFDFAAGEESDEVVFDSKVEHDRVRALG